MHLQGVMVSSWSWLLASVGPSLWGQRWKAEEAFTWAVPHQGRDVLTDLLRSASPEAQGETHPLLSIFYFDVP